jgi:hypothetical protein
MVYQTVSGTSNPNSTASEQNKKIFLGGLSYKYESLFNGF